MPNDENNGVVTQNQQVNPTSVGNPVNQNPGSTQSNNSGDFDDFDFGFMDDSSNSTNTDSAVDNKDSQIQVDDMGITDQIVDESVVAQQDNSPKGNVDQEIQDMISFGDSSAVSNQSSVNQDGDALQNNGNDMVQAEVSDNTAVENTTNVDGQAQVNGDNNVQDNSQQVQQDAQELGDDDWLVQEDKKVEETFGNGEEGKVGNDSDINKSADVVAQNVEDLMSNESSSQYIPNEDEYSQMTNLLNSSGTGEVDLNNGNNQDLSNESNTGVSAGDASVNVGDTSVNAGDVSVSAGDTSINTGQNIDGAAQNSGDATVQGADLFDNIVGSDAPTNIVEPQPSVDLQGGTETQTTNDMNFGSVNEGVDTSNNQSTFGASDSSANSVLFGPINDDTPTSTVDTQPSADLQGGTETQFTNSMNFGSVNEGVDISNNQNTFGAPDSSANSVLFGSVNDDAPTSTVESQPNVGFQGNTESQPVNDNYQTQDSFSFPNVNMGDSNIQNMENINVQDNTFQNPDIQNNSFPTIGGVNSDTTGMGPIAENVVAGAVASDVNTFGDPAVDMPVENSSLNLDSISIDEDIQNLSVGGQQSFGVNINSDGQPVALQNVPVKKRKKQSGFVVLGISFALLVLGAFVLIKMFPDKFNSLFKGGKVVEYTENTGVVGEVGDGEDTGDDGSIGEVGDGEDTGDDGNDIDVGYDDMGEYGDDENSGDEDQGGEDQEDLDPNSIAALLEGGENDENSSEIGEEPADNGEEGGNPDDNFDPFAEVGTIFDENTKNADTLKNYISKGEFYKNLGSDNGNTLVSKYGEYIMVTAQEELTKLENGEEIDTTLFEKFDSLLEKTATLLN